MTKIELIATDGTLQRKILWIDAKRKGIYYGWCKKGRDQHTSYHVDGSVFMTVDGITKKFANLDPLIGFKNRNDIGTFGFSTNLTRIQGVHYDLGAVDAIIYLDMRAYKNKGNYMNCTVELLEPERWDLLKGIERYRGLMQLQIFTNYKPWIVIRIQCVK